jgi:hypothetical protein
MQHLKIIRCNIQKPIATQKNSKDLQTARGWVRGVCCSSPGPSPSSSPEGVGNRTPELAGTLATAASLKSRGGGEELRSKGGGGGGLRSKEGLTYLVGAAAIAVSDRGSGSRVTRERGSHGGRGEGRNGGRTSGQGDRELVHGCGARPGGSLESRRAEWR